MFKKVHLIRWNVPVVDGYLYFLGVCVNYSMLTKSTCVCVCDSLLFFNDSSSCLMSTNYR